MSDTNKEREAANELKREYNRGTDRDIDSNSKKRPNVSRTEATIHKYTRPLRKVFYPVEFNNYANEKLKDKIPEGVREALFGTNPKGELESVQNLEKRYDDLAYFKKGGKIMKSKQWEGSAEDEAQDKKLAKKHGMSMSKWEKSKMDEKHDEQKSMKGLKKGGVSAYAKGGGVERKGKTNTKAVKMCGGGMKGYAAGGAISAKKADGIASKGRTKCKIR